MRFAMRLFILLVAGFCVSAINRGDIGGLVSDSNTLSASVDSQLRKLDEADNDEITDADLEVLAKHFTPDQIMRINQKLRETDELANDPASALRFAQTKGIFAKIGEGLASGASAAMGGNKPTQKFSNAHSAITPQDEACVMCQYLVEKVQAAVMEFTQSPAPPTFVETEETVTKQEDPQPTSFVEVGVTVMAKAKWGMSGSVSGTNDGGVGGLIKNGATGGKAKGPEGAIGFITSGRKRSVEFLGDMPADLRFSPLVNPSANAEQDRAKYKLMEVEVYSMVYQMCSTTMPLMYLTYCQALMRNFQRILQSLQYGDRVDQICLMIGQCLGDSYAAINPHSLVRVQAAELKKRIQVAIAMTPKAVIADAAKAEGNKASAGTVTT